METISARKARGELRGLIGEVAKNPILITGKRSNAVLVSEDDWNAINETLFLLSVPGMRKSVRNGLMTPIEQCDNDLRW